MESIGERLDEASEPEELIRGLCMSFQLVSSLRNRTFRNTSRQLQQPTTILYTLSSTMPATLRQRPVPSSQPVKTTSPLAHSHSHSHGHSHSHAHGDDEASALLAAIQGSTARGSRITLIGLSANVGLTAVKGVAGYTLGSAALLADAAHSGSDLVADVVTLATFRTARKPISLDFPYGYGSASSITCAERECS